MSRGPTPKPSRLRRRRNRSATQAVLAAEGCRRRAPPLPTDREWDPMTRAWWRDTWHSPMATEFLKADIHGLYILAELIDQFWTNPDDLKLAAEIRQHRTAFGLTPIDRRRLQWEIEKGNSVGWRREAPPTSKGRRARSDPRAYLVAIK